MLDGPCGSPSTLGVSQGARDYKLRDRLSDMPKPGPHCSDRSAIPSTRRVTYSIDEHVGVISEMVDKSLKDPETRQLAVRVVSDRFQNVRRGGQMKEVLRAWGCDFKPPGGPACGPRKDRCEIEKVWNFLNDNVRYVFDQTGVDQFATLKASLQMGGGDCDDFTIAFAALLGALGFHVAARVISTNSAPDQWVHIYAMVGLPKDNPTQWLPLDPTVEGAVPGWQFDKIAKFRDYMLVG